MSYQYGDGLYETRGAARDAAIDDWLTASGSQQVIDAVEIGDTPQSLARDMVEADWTVPGILHGGGPWVTGEDIEDLADAIQDRLDAHGVHLPEVHICPPDVMRQIEWRSLAPDLDGTGREPINVTDGKGYLPAGLYRDTRKSTDEPRRLLVLYCEKCGNVMGLEKTDHRGGANGRATVRDYVCCNGHGRRFVEKQ